MNIIIDKPTLDKIYDDEFNVEKFKSIDPCGIVHLLMEHTKNQLDIELGALFVAIISWGNRKAIRSASINMLKNEMEWSPTTFIMNGKYENCYKNTKNNCVYRTLNVDTFKHICKTLRDKLCGYQSIEEYFYGKCTKEVISTICNWLSDARIGTMDKSACKRICMYTRWMTRSKQPDFHIWKSRKQHDLYAIMDVHVCNLTRSLLKNKRPTWKACEELTNIFRSWDSEDPLKYDLALMTLADKINL